MTPIAIPRRSSLGKSLVELDSNSPASLLFDRFPNFRAHREFVCPVTQRHERTFERLAVHRAADFHQATGAEELG